MLPFRAQIAYTCNQPYDFSLWCRDQESNNLSPELDSLAMARDLIKRTKSQLDGLELKESNLSEIKQIEISSGLYLELEGTNCIQEFLIPNFYFHLVTAYDIMRMKGVPLGKANYNSHLVPFMKIVKSH